VQHRVDHLDVMARTIPHCANLMRKGINATAPQGNADISDRFNKALRALDQWLWRADARREP
jgi:hypothetical protein